MPTSDAIQMHNLQQHIILSHKVEIYILTSVGKGVIGAGVSCADTIAMEAELIRMDVIESFIFD